MPNSYFVGVDVGTGSARACLINADGKILRTAIQPIKTWNPFENHYEQSSNNIWSSVCHCVQKVIEGHDKSKIAGIGFDATCSLVIVDKNGAPLTVSKTGESEQNIILWMDHRAAAEAATINDTEHPILDFVGGKVSLEMECPKLLWLKNHLPETWFRIGKAFDLPDFLTWKATLDETRSLCSVVCKWNYDAINGKWNSEFFEQIGFEELLETDFKKLGKIALSPGTKLTKGVSPFAAKQLGLLPGTAVGVSIIDAHAGAVGLYTCRMSNDDSNNIVDKIALIAGTSTCHMSLVESQILVPGVWGPYRDVILPDLYLHEAGQSAAGALLDYVIESHVAYQKIKTKLNGCHVITYLNEQLHALTEITSWEEVTQLTKDYHVRPDFHGNRSPLADATMKGMICGLTLKSDEHNLLVVYLATIQALAYGTRDILDSLKRNGRPEFKYMLITGGLSKNDIYIRCHADACGLPVIRPKDTDMVLLGSALLGMAAARKTELREIINSIKTDCEEIQPNKNCIEYHNKKYTVFLKMYADQKAYTDIMSN